MRNIFNVFKTVKKAIAFIDYEYCFYSYMDTHKIKPCPVIWKKKLEEKYELSDIMVFGDFTQKEISEELRKLRSITNTIIETSNVFLERKKDMTDFIMLDYIYQSVESRKDVDTYILFTGDGHFQSVVKYLRQKKKTVIVCGIRETMSNQLRSVASEIADLPIEEERYVNYYKLIASNMNYVEQFPKIVPTFMRTVENVARKNNLPEELVADVLRRMIQKGYITKKVKRMSNGDVRYLEACWDKMIEDGIC